jgi:hypothetical protein
MTIARIVGFFHVFASLLFVVGGEDLKSSLTMIIGVLWFILAELLELNTKPGDE